MTEFTEDGNEKAAFRHVLSMAEKGDKNAVEIFERTANLLGHTVADIINLVDTEMVILAGFMVEENSDYFFEMIRDAAGKYLLENPRRSVSIVQSALGYDGAIIGGAMLAYQDAFSVPEWGKG
jgi:predicted NBD/HSP70 family sugar kinase